VDALDKVGRGDDADLDVEGVEHLLAQQGQAGAGRPLGGLAARPGRCRRLGRVGGIDRPLEGRLSDIISPVIGQKGQQHLMTGDDIVQVTVDDGWPVCVPVAPLPSVSTTALHLASSVERPIWSESSLGVRPG
jgi:hypothetical protein